MVSVCTYKYDSDHNVRTTVLTIIPFPLSMVLSNCIKDSTSCGIVLNYCVQISMRHIIA